MTHTTEVTHQNVAGNHRIVSAQILITSYTAAGEVLTDLTEMFGSVDSAVFQAAGSTGYLFNWDAANKKVIVRTATATVASTGAYVGKVDVMMRGV